MSNFYRQRGFLDPSRLFQARMVENSGVAGSMMQGSNLNSAGAYMAAGAEHSGSQVIFGTTINLEEIQTKEKNFINHFQQELNEDDVDFSAKPFYLTKILDLQQTEQKYLEVDMDHVF